MARSRSERSSSLIWPGFVDAMTALLLVLMFVLSIFMVVQFVLREQLGDKDRSLQELNLQLSKLSDQLSTAEERALTAEKSLDITTLNLNNSLLRIEGLEANLETSEARVEELAAEIAAFAAREAEISGIEQRNEDLQTALNAAEADALTFEERLAALELALDEKKREAENTLLLLAAAELKQKELSDEAVATVTDKERAQAAAAFARASLQQEKEISASGRQAIALLNQQVQNLRAQIGFLRLQLDAAEEKDAENQVVIEDLGARLNQALAQKVDELQRYRSEFFGRLRDVIGSRNDIQIVGDRFVFQSEVLFSTGSAELGAAGRRELSRFAGLLRAISSDIPPEVSWILRIDGHTDRVPITGGIYRNNWELSQARALSVVEFLINQENIPPQRLAATGFGEYQPIDPENTREAFARNRRIELKLTER
ncbi:MAG: peptidoglycan -binding protein [Pseudomonadota bacterium]